MASRTLEINGAELSYFEAGEGPPVVLVNGILADQRSWRRQIEALSPKYRVFALSPRYYWPNKWPDDGAGFGVATFVADLVALLRKLDLPPVHLLGHSFGGGVVSEFAVQYPGLVCSLVLAEPAVFTIALDDPAMMSAIAEFGENRKAIFNEWQSGKREKAVDKLLLSIIGSKAVERIRDEHLGILYENADILGAAFRPRPLPPPFTLEQARTLTMPVLVVEGETTKPMYRIACERLESCLPDVQRIVLPDTSHALCLESPDAFNEATVRFLDELTAS